MPGRDSRKHRTGSDTGEKDDDVKPAVDEFAGKPKRVVVRLPRHFAQRGRQEADAAQLRNERGDLGASAAFEGKDTSPVKRR